MIISKRRSLKSNADSHITAQSLSHNITIFKIVRAHKLANTMGVLISLWKLHSRCMTGTNINTYAIVTNMLPARDTIWVHLSDIWYDSLEILEITKMNSKSAWYCKNTW